MNRYNFSSITVSFLFLTFLIFITKPIFAAESITSNKLTNLKILTIADMHISSSTNHEMNLNPSFYNPLNDMDTVTFQKLLDVIQTNISTGNISKPDCIILLGDLIGHFSHTQKNVFQSEKLVFKSLKRHFPAIPIFYVFGNNDSFKRDYGPFTYKNLSTPYMVAKQSGWLDGFLSTGVMCNKKNNIFPCLINENKKNGHYAAYIQSKLKMIVFNSVDFSLHRKYISSEVAQSELHWLQRQLQDAKTNNERILLVTHIPPVNNLGDHSKFWQSQEEMDFLKILNAYKDICITMLVGHTHYDELKIIRDASHKVVASILFTPALSSSHGNAASLRIYDFTNHGKQWEMSDYTTFNFSTSADNGINMNNIYRFRDYYCQNPLTDKFNDCLLNVTWEKMKKYYTAGNPNFKGIFFAPQDIFLDAELTSNK